jgi:hypothetical protein
MSEASIYAAEALKLFTCMSSKFDRSNRIRYVCARALQGVLQVDQATAICQQRKDGQNLSSGQSGRACSMDRVHVLDAASLS